MDGDLMIEGSGGYGCTVSIERPYRIVSRAPTKSYPYRIRIVSTVTLGLMAGNLGDLLHATLIFFWRDDSISIGGNSVVVWPELLWGGSRLNGSTSHALRVPLIASDK
jgi:hypothetical protein